MKTKKKTVQPTLEQKIKRVLGNYFKTQLMLMVIVGVVTWGILALLNVKFAVTLAIMTGILSAIPNFGIVIATAVATLVAIFDNVVFLPNSQPIVEGVVVLVIFVLFNRLVDFFLAPVFLGKTNKINPFILFLLVILGTVFFGVPGAILSVPVFLVVRVIWKHFSN
jgi:predicted PurR-regulated permease PerM